MEKAKHYEPYGNAITQIFPPSNDPLELMTISMSSSIHVACPFVVMGALKGPWTKYGATHAAAVMYAICLTGIMGQSHQMLMRMLEDWKNRNPVNAVELKKAMKGDKDALSRLYDTYGR